MHNMYLGGSHYVSWSENTTQARRGFLGTAVTGGYELAGIGAEL